MNVIDRLFSDSLLTKRKPALEIDIEKLETQIGGSLPSTFKALYRQSDGFNVPSSRLNVLPISKISKYYDNLIHSGVPRAWNYVPFTDSNDSNPFCICCSEPLNGRIVHLMHDDASVLAFSSIDAFFTAVVDLMNDDIGHIDNIIFDYDSGHRRRSSKDWDDATKLFDLATQLDDSEQLEALSYAVTLVSHQKAATVISYLRHKSMFVREFVATRLGAMGALDALPELENLAASGDCQDAEAARQAVQQLQFGKE